LIPSVTTESFRSQPRDERLEIEEFVSLAEAKKFVVRRQLEYDLR
jgi:hypothetical protein